MNAITLESIKAEHNKVAEMIAAFEAQAATTYHFPEATIDMRPGEHYAGIILGKDGDPSHHLVLLPGDAESVNWKDAIAWATEQGGELPTRREQSLLYANLKEQFEGAAYWSAQEYDSAAGYACYQGFGLGYQGYHHKLLELRARAVRRLVIE